MTLCSKCVNYELVLEVPFKKGDIRMEVECYFPANNNKVDKCSSCDDFKPSSEWSKNAS